MASVVKAANAHAIVTTGWTNPSNAFALSGDNTYATAVTAKNATTNGDFGFPDFTSSDIPDGATINSVTVTVEWGMTASVTGGLLGVQLLRSGVALGTETTQSSITEAQATQQVTTGISLADLRSASTLIKARVRTTKGNSSTAMSGNLDFITLTVDYTPATPTGLRLELREGATLRASATLADVTSLTDADLLLTTVERNAITDWSALQVWLVATAGGIGQIDVAEVWLTAPGAVVGGENPFPATGLSASSSLAAALIDLVTIAAAPTGSGTLVSPLVNVVTLSATMSGSGSVGAPLGDVIRLSAAASGSGSVAAPLGAIAALVAGSSGSGALVAPLGDIIPLVAALSGSGTLAAPLGDLALLAAALSGQGTLAAPLLNLTRIAAALAGAGSLDGSGLLNASAGISATLAGSGSVSAALGELARLSAAASGAGTLAGTPANVVTISAALAGSSSVGAALGDVAPLIAALSGSASVAASASAVGGLDADLLGSGSVGATPTTAGGVTLLRIELRQGATLIASLEVPDSTSLTTADLLLTAPQRASITNWSALQAWLVAHGDLGKIDVAEVSFTLPVADPSVFAATPFGQGTLGAKLGAIRPLTSSVVGASALAGPVERCPQIAVPVSVVSAGAWIAQPGGTLADVLADFSDDSWAESPVNPTSSATRVRFATLAQPEPGTATLAIRHQRTGTSGSLVVNLWSGGVVRATRTLTPITTDVIEDALALTAGEWASINQTGAIDLELVATAAGGGVVQVLDAWLLAPAAAVSGGVVTVTAALAGTSVMSAPLRDLVPLSGAFVGSAAVVPLLINPRTLSAAMAGSAAASALLWDVVQVSATVIGSATTGAPLLRLVTLNASPSGQGALGASFGGLALVVASLAGTSSLAAASGAVQRLAGGLSGAGTLAGDLSGPATLVAALVGTGAISASVLAGLRALAANPTGLAGLGATLGARWALIAAPAGLGDLDAHFSPSAVGLIGTMIGAAIVSSALGDVSPLSAALAGLGAATGDLGDVQAVSAAVSASGTFAVTPGALRDLGTTLLAGQGTLSGTPSLLAALAAALTGAGALVTTLNNLRPLDPATMVGLGSPGATLTLLQLLGVAQIVGDSDLTAPLVDVRSLAAALSASGAVSVLAGGFIDERTLTAALTGQGAADGLVLRLQGLVAALDGLGAISAQPSGVFASQAILGGLGSMHALLSGLIVRVIIDVLDLSHPLYAVEDTSHPLYGLSDRSHPRYTVEVP